MLSVLNNAVWGRSRWQEETIRKAAARYVATTKHAAAIEILDQYHVVVVTGEPGVWIKGQTDRLLVTSDHFTLANRKKSREAVVRFLNGKPLKQ